MLLALHHDQPSSAECYEELKKLNLIEKLKTLDSRARRKGLEELDPSRNPLIGLGMETDGNGRVTKNSYGVFNLSWQVENHPEWAAVVEKELAELRKRIRDTHSVPLRYLIWAGMGGSAEDKAMYSALGLLRRGPRVYILDSTDPAKLKAILSDMAKRSAGSQTNALKSTLVAGMAMGMTSYEPVVNLEKLAALYERHKIDSRPNFVYMTLPNSLLDKFGRKRGYRRVELQLDGANSTAGRHSGPLTRGSLYPLGLCGMDLQAWMQSTMIGRDCIEYAWQLAAFLHSQARHGRDKVTLLLPKEWAAGCLDQAGLRGEPRQERGFRNQDRDRRKAEAGKLLPAEVRAAGPLLSCRPAERPSPLGSAKDRRAPPCRLPPGGGDVVQPGAGAVHAVHSLHGFRTRLARADELRHPAGGRVVQDDYGPPVRGSRKSGRHRKDT